MHQALYSAVTRTRRAIRPAPTTGDDGADQLTADGTLGQQQLFKDTLPDVDSATAVVYVDVRKVAELSGERVPEEGKAVASFGLTVSTSGDDSGIHLRLVAD